MNSALKDSNERAIIKNDIKTNLLVEAGAGSGKTSEMSNRIVSLVISGYRKIGEISAITFTKKAANELQDRVRKKLQSEYETTKNPYLKEAIDKYNECFIGTIHSFCGKLLRERPVEAEVDPSFEELDELEDLEIRKKALEEFIFSADEESKALLKELYKFSVNDNVLDSFLKLVCNNQDVEFDTITVRTDFSEIEAEVSKVFEELKNEIAKLRHDMHEGITLNDDIDELQKSILLFNKKSENCEETFENKLKAVKLFKTKSSVKVTLKRWASDKERTKEIKGMMEQFREERVLPLILKVNTYVYNNLLIPFAKRAMVTYQGYKARNSKLNFQDLLLKTSNMLRDNPDVREYFQTKYKTILVDEFQDTDPIQSQLLMYLVGEALNEKAWDKLIPKEGSLFVVGDPKQSIYAFRRADIEIYEKFKNIIINTGGKCVELISNFRTVSKIGEWYNFAFDKLLNEKILYSYDDTMSEQLQSVSQARFSGMSTVNESLDGTLSGVFYYEDESGVNDEMFFRDSNNLERIIKWLVNTQKITVLEDTENGKKAISRKLSYKDIMVLTMKKNYLGMLSTELSKAGIPVKVTGAEATQKTSSFLLLANIIKMLAYPEENAYLYRVMIDFPFLLKRKELVDFIKLGGRFNIYFNFEEFYKKNKLSDEELLVFEKINKCFSMLRRFMDYSKNIPCGALVERIIVETGINRNLISSKTMVTELGSFTSLIEQIRLNSVTDIWGVDKLAENIKSMFLRSLEEENDIQGADYDAVRIMNLHKAKGLEAPVVILAMPFGASKIDESLYVERIVDEELGSLYKGHVSLKVKNGKNNSSEAITSSKWACFEPMANYKAMLEKDRTLYVAATRPRNVLIIGSCSKNNPWEKLVNLLPNNTENIFEYVENNRIEDTEFSEELVSFDVFNDINKINIKRNQAFNDNQATFSEVAPSKLNMVNEISEELSIDIDNLIKNNVISTDIKLEDKIPSADMQLGTIIHKLFETRIKEPESIELVISEILAQTQLKEVTEEFLRNIIVKFEESTIYKRLIKSDKVYTEVPFSIKDDNNVYTMGTIDLVFLENNRWVIVDYKTCDKSQDKKVLYREYMSQLLAYKNAWDKISGSLDTSIELYFIEKG